MILEFENCDLRYDVQSVCLLFFPREPFSEEQGKRLKVSLFSDCAEALFLWNGRSFREQEPFDPQEFDSDGGETGGLSSASAGNGKGFCLGDRYRDSSGESL